MKGNNMPKLNTRKIYRQCFVPGCSNTNSYMVYRGSEPWAKVVMCETCAKELYETFVPASAVQIAEKEGKNEGIKEEESAKIARKEAEKDATVSKAPRKKAEAK